MFVQGCSIVLIMGGLVWFGSITQYAGSYRERFAFGVLVRVNRYSAFDKSFVLGKVAFVEVHTTQGPTVKDLPLVH